MAGSLLFTNFLDMSIFFYSSARLEFLSNLDWVLVVFNGLSGYCGGCICSVELIIRGSLFFWERAFWLVLVLAPLPEPHAGLVSCGLCVLEFKLVALFYMSSVLFPYAEPRTFFYLWVSDF